MIRSFHVSRKPAVVRASRTFLLLLFVCLVVRFVKFQLHWHSSKSTLIYHLHRPFAKFPPKIIKIFHLRNVHMRHVKGKLVRTFAWFFRIFVSSQRRGGVVLWSECSLVCFDNRVAFSSKQNCSCKLTADWLVKLKGKVQFDRAISLFSFIQIGMEDVNWRKLPTCVD